MTKQMSVQRLIPKKMEQIQNMLNEFHWYKLTTLCCVEINPVSKSVYNGYSSTVTFYFTIIILTGFETDYEMTI